MAKEEESEWESLGLGLDERREAAIASLQLHQHPSTHQLAKLQELHKRRLKLKSKSKSNKSQGNGRIVDKYEHNPKHCAHQDEDEDEDEDATIPLQNSTTSKSTKRRKLHWGLDTKERWERKANM